MSIRVLCLHGMGTDSTVFKAQISHFLELLPDYYSFSFPDAPVLCDPSPGVADHYPGPYRCWFNTPTNAKVAQAYEWVRKMIRQSDGRPFDVVIGFSQGAALAAGMLLHQQLEHPDAPPLFRAAMFICSPLPFVCTPNHGFDIRRYFGIEPVPSPSLVGRPNIVPDYLVAEAYFLRNDEDLETDPMETDTAIAKACSGGTFYNMFHPTVDEVRIQIPTAHVYGRRDSWRGHSMDLRDLCDSKKRLEFEHDGGHEVPRSASEEICDVFEELMVRAGLV